MLKHLGEFRPRSSNNYGGLYLSTSPIPQQFKNKGKKIDHDNFQPIQNDGRKLTSHVVAITKKKNSEIFVGVYDVSFVEYFEGLMNHVKNYDHEIDGFYEIKTTLLESSEMYTTSIMGQSTISY